MMNWILSFPRLMACTYMQYKTPEAPVIPHSLDGKVAIVTGGSSGVGLETCKALAIQGCHVFMLCRNPQKAEEAVVIVNKACKEEGDNGIGKCASVRCDLADLQSVQESIVFIRKLIEDGIIKKIDFLICNGGIMMQPYSKSSQGYEIHYATNHLGHFALIGGLIDYLCSSHAKIVVITGDIAILAVDATPDFEYNDSGLIAYCRSKICTQSFVRELHKLYGNELIVYCVHPGVINSNLVQPMDGIIGFIEPFVRSISMIDCKQGAQSTLYCCLTDNVPHGAYFHNVFHVCNYHPTAANNEWSENMWNISLQLIKEHRVLCHYKSIH